MRIRELALAATCVALALPHELSAQTATERAVRAVVDSFFAAVSREKWDSAAALIDLPRFEPHFKEVVSNARVALPQPEITVEQLMESDSTMPRAVAEWQFAQMKKYGHSRNFGDMSYELAGVHSQHELFALTLPDAAARWLEARDERTQMRETWRRSGCPLNELPAFSPVKRTVLAVAVANDSTAYVIHSDDRFGAYQASLYDGERLMRVRRTNGRWRVEAREDLLRPTNMSFGFDCRKREH